MKAWYKLIAVALCVATLTGCVILTPQETDSTGESTSPTGSTVASTPSDTENTTPNDPGSSGPSKPVTPGDSEDPTDPSDSSDPADPSQPTEPAEPFKPGEPPADGIYDIGIDPLPYSEEELYQQLFDPNNKIKLDLDMSGAELQKLQDDYDHYRGFGSKSPIYRMGTLRIAITTAAGTTVYRINEVGARMKGNTSRTDFYNSNDGIYKYIHLKLDFQETFDDPTYYGSSAKQWASEEERDARKDRTFAALEQLELRWNKCYDPTYLRETYAYELYRSEDVMAPLTNLCSFDWSRNHMGVFCIVEPVDKAFLEKRFDGDDADGDLYKCGWTNQPCNFTNTNSIGIEDEDQGKFYCYDLKNNKKTSTHAALKNLINKLNSPSLTKEGLAQIVDMDNFLRFAAVSYFLGNPDDIRNNYNNFYLYFVPSTGKAMFIPYDYDRCLGITYEWNPTGNGVTEDDPFGEKIAASDNNGGQGQKSPLFLKTVVKGGFYVKEFAEVLKDVATNDLLKIATFESWFYRANNLYCDDVKPSREFYNAGGRDFKFTLADNVGGNLSMKTYLTKKMATYNRYIATVDDILDYERPEQTIYYIRGDFNNWQDTPQYAMTIKDNKASITISISSNQNRFKVYNSVQQLWYGTLDMSEDTTVPYETAGNHDNIRLKAGRYKIVFDLDTMKITITAA